MVTAAGEPKEARGKIYLDTYLDGVSALPAEICRVFSTVKDISSRNRNCWRRRRS